MQPQQTFILLQERRACVLFLLNWKLWQPLHNVHHLGPKLTET